MFNIRVYHSFSIVVTVSLLLYSFQSALDGGFERLFAYINGSNVDNEKIAMTTPVKSRVIQGRLKDKYVVSFYVPYKYQKPHDPPPKPSDSKVYVDSQSEMDVAVVSFDGFEHEREDERQKEDLEKFLKKEGIRYESGDWIFAGYDPPFRLTGRHNEVWVKVDK